MFLTLTPLLSALLLLLLALVGLRGPALWRAWVARSGAQLGALAAFGTSLMGLFIVVQDGAVTSPLVGGFGVGLSARIDALSVAMLILVGFVGWVVVRYAATYLQGEASRERFMAWLCATLAAVLLLVVAGNLIQFLVAWIGMSLALHHLLLFYSSRLGARRAALKKFVFARISDVALTLAVVILVLASGHTDIAAVIAFASQAESNAWLVWAAGLLALAAILKTAQFPTHGWLTEVMETPTPVSALLHAGVINAGGFLLIRFADVLLNAPIVMAGLVILGGFTALFGALVMLTQPAIKTALAWSTVSQMGFMIMQCGLGLFALALLHLLAHSLYKAHAFLSSGESVIRVGRAVQLGPVAVPNGRAVAAAFGLALLIYALVALIPGLGDKSPQALTLGAILVFGVAYLIAQGRAGSAPKTLMRMTALYGCAATIAYFSLHALISALTADLIPAVPPAGALEWLLIMIALLSFGLVAYAQALFPLWSGHPAARGLRVHLANGLYVNALTDRLMRRFNARRRSSAHAADSVTSLAD